MIFKLGNIPLALIHYDYIQYELYGSWSKRTHIFVKTYSYQNVPSKTYLPKRTQVLVKMYHIYICLKIQHFKFINSFR